MDNKNTMNQGLTVGRVEWIVKYLEGKDVTKNDLMDFFTIQNGEKKVEVTEKKENEEYTYQLSHGLFFDVTLEKVKDLKSTYTITGVGCRLEYCEG